MTINLEDNNPRIEYSVAQGVTQDTFAVPFEFFNDSDLIVYVDDVLKEEGIDYTITGGDGSTGNIEFVPAIPPAVQQVTGATGGSQVVIIRRTAVERTSDFSSGADINRAALNEQLDILTAMIADLNDRVDRGITLSDSDVVNYQFVLPETSLRTNKYLAFGPEGNLAVAAGTSSDVIVSSFGATLVDDINAAAALQTLGLTATAAELNILDGVTATTAELNFVDGVTSAIQTQLDGKQTLQSNLTNLAAMAGSGIMVRNTSGTYVNRSIAAGFGIVVTNGSGISSAPTIAADFASEAEAQAGTDNAHVMTPLRVAQAITAQTDYVWSAVTNTTSGTAFDFTGLPAGIQEVVVAFNGVRLSVNDDVLIQLGTSASFVVTGYVGQSAISSSSSPDSYTNGIGLRISTGVITGPMTIVRVGTNNWYSSHTLVRGSGFSTIIGANQVPLGAELTRLRITRIGTATFNLGSIQVGYR